MGHEGRLVSREGGRGGDRFPDEARRNRGGKTSWVSSAGLEAYSRRWDRRLLTDLPVRGPVVTSCVTPS